MTQRDEIVSTLHKFIVEKILRQPERILTAEEPLITSGVVDSFSLVDLGLFVEDNFGIVIHDAELNSSSFDTLAELAALIETRQSK